MPLVDLCDRNDVAPEDLPALEAGEKMFGQTLYTWSAILNCPGIFSKYLPFVRAVSGPGGSVDVRIKDLTAVRVGVLNHCKYTVSHRCAASTNDGISEQELVAVAKGDFSSFSEGERVALELAEAMTLEIPTVTRAVSEAGVDDALLTRAKNEFTSQQLTELTMAIGLWNALTRFHRVMEFDWDLPQPPADVLKEV